MVDIYIYVMFNLVVLFYLNGMSQSPI